MLPCSLKDLVVRTETNKLVTDLVDFDRVQSLLLMILYRRRYLAQREQARMQQYGLVQSGQYLRRRLRLYPRVLTSLQTSPPSLSMTSLPRRQ